MIAILLSYFFILYISLGIGVIFNKWIRLDNYNILFTVLIGFFFQIITSTFYAFYFPVNYYFFLINLTISTLFITCHFSLVKKIIRNTINSFSQFSISSKFLFLTIIIISLIHSSSVPFITDNESYYIQTIKWLNNYGLVKGLANLHLFFGQSSGWHILQSGFNFSFIAPNFNDLNGFLIIITSFFCLEKWGKYKLTGNKNDLFISLIIISLVFLFLFIASPSPDLPTIIIVPIIIYLFVESFHNNNNNSTHINLITVLILLVILIKVTVSPILILLLITLVKTKDFKHWKFPIVLSFIALSSFIIKNIVVTGYPLYPLSIGHELINVDWKLNNNLQQVYYQWTSMYGWQMNNWEEFSNLSFINKFWIWLNLPRLDGLLNKLILLSLFLFPFFNYKKKEMLYLYIYFLIQFIIFYITSPQYRFFLPVLLSIGLLISTDLLHKRVNIIKFLFVLNLVLLTLLGVLGLNFEGITNNNIMSMKHSLIPSQVISPRSITQFEDLEFIEYEIQNLKYFSPSKDSLFFWQTSNGPLPCVNKDMIEYFSTYYNHIPQMRTKNIKDGFLSSKPEHK
jgi:hypothetical protein